MEFHIKKSRFRVKSRFKEWKGADGGHSLNWDFTVLHFNQIQKTESWSMKWITRGLYYFPKFYLVKIQIPFQKQQH